MREMQDREPRSKARMRLATLKVGALATNCYLVGCALTGRALVIDPGGDADRILAGLGEMGFCAEAIVLTHGHFDHYLAALEVKRATKARILIHRLDEPFLSDPPPDLALFMLRGGQERIVPDELLEDAEQRTLGMLSWQVIHVPGHSPGSIALWFPDLRVVFSGDALFREGVGRADLSGGDARTLVESIRRRLYTLPDDAVVYPGHGPATTIGHEKRANPFVRADRF